MRYFTATAHREGECWAVDVNDVGTTQGRNVTEAERMAHALVVDLLELPANQVHVDVDFGDDSKSAAEMFKNLDYDLSEENLRGAWNTDRTEPADETEYLLRSPANARRLLESVDQATTHEFTLILDREPNDDEIETLYEAGLSDAGIEYGNGTCLAHFGRKAPRFAFAVDSAIRNVRAAGFSVTGFEME